MREEMDVHLARSTERFMARGMSEPEARLAAQREFGNVEYLQELSRDVRGGAWVASVLSDAGFALRHYLRTPLATITILLLLVLGIGVNTGLFAVVHSQLTAPPPGVPDDDALVRIRGTWRMAERAHLFRRGLSYPEIFAYREHPDVIAGVAAWTISRAVLEGAFSEWPVPVTVHYIDNGYFELLGVRPQIGGTAALRSGIPAAIIGDGLWRRHFVGSQDLVGRLIRLNGVAVSVAGVGPADFRGAEGLGTGLHVWLPLGARPAVEGGSSNDTVRSSLPETNAAPSSFALSSPDSTLFTAVARLAEGASLERANALARSISDRFAAATTDPPRGEISADVVPLRNSNAYPGGEDWAEIGAVALLALFVLLITCTNVGGLLVGLSVRRRREIGMRLSLGASRGRLIRQLVTETVVLAVAAGGLVLGVIWVLSENFGSRVAGPGVAIEWPAVGFGVALAVVAGVVFGLAPAFHATRAGLSRTVQDSGSLISASESRLHKGLVVTQIALAQPLLAALAALVLFIAAEWMAHPSREVHEQVVSLEMVGTGGSSPDDLRSALTRFARRLETLPEVVSVVPQASSYRVYNVAVSPSDVVPGRPTAPFMVREQEAPPGYFRLMEIPITRGRRFERGLDSAATSIIVASDLARELWGNANPLGRRLVHVGERGGNEEVAGVVVGVVDEAQAGPSRTANGQTRIFVPHVRVPGGLLVRIRSAAAQAIPLLRSIATTEVPEMPVSTAETMASIATRQRAQMTQAGTAVSAGGLLVLFLAALGLYAVLAFTVGQRKREIGVRAALGAGHGRIVSAFFLRGLKMTAVGLGIGLPLSIMSLHFISEAFGYRGVPLPILVGIVAVMVLAVSCLATWIPARRAARVSPMSALRVE